MRTLLSLSLLAVVLLGAGGCVESSETLVLRADGGGTLVVEHAFRPAALSALLARVREALAPVLPEGAAPRARGAARPADPAWLSAAARAAPGLAWTTLAADASDPERVVTRGAGAFASLEALARGGGLLGANVSLERLPKRQGWRLSLREPWTPSGPGAHDAFGGLLPAELERALGGCLAALTHRLTLTLPVPVRSTNGTLSADGRTVTWSARADGPATPVLVVDFALPDESEWAAFRYAPDLAALARRCLVPPPEQPPPPREPAQAPGPGAAVPAR